MQIRAIGVGREFVSGAALRGVDLSVESGELMALLGPSGSGKTTLLRVIAGLERLDRGRVLFGEEDATAIPVRDRGVGFVFQSYALFRHMSVADNVAFGLRARRGPKPGRGEVAARVAELLRLVQLDGYGARLPASLSGGQRQRVALARALAVRPRVLLLDEPFGALDARVRRDLRRSLREIHDATGQTTIFVTHDQDEALELADRVAVLNAGRIEQVGTPDAIHDDPASAFVMGFVGEIATLPVMVRPGRVELDGQPVPVPAGPVPEGPARLFVRPADLALAPVDGWPGRVIMLRRAAGGRRAEVRLDGDAERLVEVGIGPDDRKVRGDAVRVLILGGRVFPAS